MESIRKEKILLLGDENQKEPFEFVRNNLKDYDFIDVSSIESCLEEIDNNDTKIVLVYEDTANWPYEYFLNKVKLTLNTPSVVVLSKKIDDAMYVNSLYSLGCASCLVKDDEWESKLSITIRHIIRSQKLEEINRELTMRLTEVNMMLNQKNNRLDEFCRTVAHDIRGPLGGLIMRLEYLIDKYDQVPKERFKTLLNSSLEVSSRLIEQVQAMYEFAKLGKEATNMDFFDMNVVISSLLEDMNLSDDKNISFTIDNFPFIWGSKELVRRVFINLISNAIKYNDNEKKTIYIGFGGIEKLPMGIFAKIFVKDNGIGIPEKSLNDIFKLFNRVSSKKDDDGLGVGLSVVQRSVELHMGKIEVTSKLGMGSNFTFWLPAKEVKM